MSVDVVRVELYPGKIFVVEGIDGSGKTGFLGYLYRWCKQCNVPVKAVSFPRYETPTGERVKAYLAGEMGNPNPWKRAWLFAVDRLAAKDYLLTLRKMGYLVAINRYDISNYAFQGARFPSPAARKLFILAVRTLERGIFRIPKPDLVIFLDMPADLAFELKKEQRTQEGGTPDIHERDFLYQQQVAAVYHELYAKSQFDWLVIPCVHNDGLLGPAEIFASAKDYARFSLPVLELGVLNLLSEAGDTGLSVRDLKSLFPEEERSRIELVLLRLEGQKRVSSDRRRQRYYLRGGGGR